MESPRNLNVETPFIEISDNISRNEPIVVNLGDREPYLTCIDMKQVRNLVLGKLN